MPRQPDPKLPEAQVSIRDFAGFMPNADPHDLPPGVAVSQVNVTSLRPGELRVRGGTRVVQFED